MSSLCQWKRRLVLTRDVRSARRMHWCLLPAAVAYRLGDSAQSQINFLEKKEKSKKKKRHQKRPGLERTATSLTISNYFLTRTSFLQWMEILSLKESRPNEWRRFNIYFRRSKIAQFQTTPSLLALECNYWRLKIVKKCGFVETTSVLDASSLTITMSRERWVVTR